MKRTPKQLKLFHPFTGPEVTVAWTADMLRCSTRTVQRYIEAGLIEAYSMVDGGWLRVSFDSVVHFMGNVRRRHALDRDSERSEPPLSSEK